MFKIVKKKISSYTFIIPSNHLSFSPPCTCNPNSIFHAISYSSPLSAFNQSEINRPLRLRSLAEFPPSSSPLLLRQDIHCSGSTYHSPVDLLVQMFLLRATLHHVGHERSADSSLCRFWFVGSRMVGGFAVPRINKSRLRLERAGRLGANVGK